jgi:peptide/nickel transport system permease protein
MRESVAAAPAIPLDDDVGFAREVADLDVPWSRRISLFVRNQPLGTIGLALVAGLIVTAILAPLIAPYSYEFGAADDRLQPPNWTHLLGTDASGRDMFSRILYGSRISITVGFGAVLIATGLATVIGTVSGYFGGWLDLVVQRLVDTWISFPALVLLISFVSVFGPGLWNITIILGILLAPGASRVIRGSTLAMRHQPYVEAALCLGASHWRILLRHILPNVFTTVIVLATVQLGAAILAESTLAFLGYGVPPPYPAWGSMLSGTGRAFMLQSPWLSIWPGLAISLAVFGFNVLGDALRDELDPRLRGGRSR